jgi:hypothetical protein
MAERFRYGKSVQDASYFVIESGVNGGDPRILRRAAFIVASGTAANSSRMGRR